VTSWRDDSREKAPFLILNHGSPHRRLTSRRWGDSDMRIILDTSFRSDSLCSSLHGQSRRVERCIRSVSEKSRLLIMQLVSRTRAGKASTKLNTRAQTS
jgi:hypothetical protein